MIDPRTGRRAPPGAAGVAGLPAGVRKLARAGLRTGLRAGCGAESHLLAAPAGR
jgi:hypothetical protein